MNSTRHAPPIVTEPEEADLYRRDGDPGPAVDDDWLLQAVSTALLIGVGVTVGALLLLLVLR